MAIRQECGDCGKMFNTNSITWRCEDCDGTAERKQKEEERWQSLTPDEKCDELRDMFQKFYRRMNARF